MAGKEISGPAFFCMVVWLPSYMTEPFRKSGLRFRILPFAYGLLLMQNSHLSVLRQATPQSLERVASWKPRHIFITGSVYNSAADTTFERTGVVKDGRRILLAVTSSNGWMVINSR